MKRLTSILLILIAVLMTACRDRVTNILSLEYYQDSASEVVEVYKHDHRFDGEAWNKDENFSVSAVRGILTTVTMYYNSGSIAIKESDNREYYDSDGMVISAEKFRAMHPHLESQFDSLRADYIHIIKYGNDVVANLP